MGNINKGQAVNLVKVRPAKSPGAGVGKLVEASSGTFSDLGAKKVIVFDFGSVLRVKTAERHDVIVNLARQVKRQFKDLGVKKKVPKSEMELRNLIKPRDWKDTVGSGKITRTEGFINGFKELNLPHQSEEEKQFIAEFQEELDFGGKEVMDEMRNMLMDLKKDPKVELAVLSNHSIELIDWFKQRYELIPNIFEEENVIVSAKVKCQKPDPQIFQTLLDMLEERVDGFIQKVHKENILLVDNREENCEAARKLGLKAFCYVHDPHNKIESFSNLEKTVRDFIES